MTNTPSYTFEIIPKSWSKRRKPSKDPVPVFVEIPDLVLKQQYFCNMNVTYDDYSQRTFYSRVIFNQLTEQWTVDGMHVAVRVILT
ncbi:hypothetical protein [Paraglaciecola sp.]|uniref:hypothetical protein n=1 Tax=Paraglaciecola sp. TaxID=1920173 RepID=UPI003EFAC48E